MSPFGQQLHDFIQTAGPGCRLRLAPTPSGFLHAGNALNFIFNWVTARYNHGTLLLRIDDLDADRKRPEYVQDVFDSLQWLGIDWDTGPKSAPDFEQNWSQHLRLPSYFTQLEKLRSTGLLFACRKSRSDLAPFQGIYPVEFRDQGLSLDDPDVAWRIQTPPGFSMPDFVVRRRDGIPAYQVASLTDDVHFGITHVVRGMDLETSTEAQKFLAACLREDNFLKIKFLHHPLVLDASGEKLSKSAGASSLQAMRSAGADPAFVFRQSAQLSGIPVGQAKTLQNLLNFFQS
ncbi:MAG TPA: glutamate--tRNA ligase family protein [Saprospiraceae bacterium]|nr:glutamate--tRNA ligase family protein [Saprospiraceae bacterium]HPI06774.1 glutamate--tRNA ligase family protein [Saprospiraceae bacterium]